MHTCNQLYITLLTTLLHCIPLGLSLWQPVSTDSAGSDWALVQTRKGSSSKEVTRTLQALRAIARTPNVGSPQVGLAALLLGLS